MSSRMQVVGRKDFAAVPFLDRVPDLRALKPSPVIWMVSSLIPAESLVLLAGSPGHYKSWISLDIAIAVASGGLFANLGTAGPRPVLYLDRENGPYQVANRLRAMGLDGSQQLRNIRYWGSWVPLSLPAIDTDELLEWAAQTRGLFVFDSLVRFHSAKENDSTEMAIVMGRFIRLARAGATVLLLHHASKDATVKYRGSEEIVAACDVCLNVKKDATDRRLVKIDTFKNRVCEERVFKLRLGQGGRFQWED